MTEQNQRKCKICGISKVRKLDGKYPDEKNKKWVDDNDRLWNGKVCPDCHAEKIKQQMKAKRAKTC